MHLSRGAVTYSQITKPQIKHPLIRSRERCQILSLALVRTSALSCPDSKSHQPAEETRPV